MEILTPSIERCDFIIYTQNEFVIRRTRQSFLVCNSALLFLATFLLAVPHGLEASIINADSLAPSSVQSAINSAIDGDTVVLPAGTTTWTSKLSIGKAITLQGSGVGSTIIKDGVQSGQLLLWTLVAGKASRMTGIEFQNGGRITAAWAPTGVLRFVGSNTNGSAFRLDNCKLTELNGAVVFDTVIGVVDHNIVSESAGGFFAVYGTRWDDDTGGRGDKSWAAATNFGSSQFLFFEDNTYTCTGGAVRGMTDAYGGGRFVVRHNTLNNANVNSHGTESTGRTRGVRAIEVYNNTFIGSNFNSIVGNCRGGVLVFHDNTISGYQTAAFYLHCHRMFFAFTPWGGANGTNQWDVNQSGGPFFTGITSGASRGTNVTVADNPRWTPNQWVGYSVKRTTNLSGAPGPVFSEISSNTADTLIYSSSGGYGGSNLSFVNGDSLQIWKVDQALDQPGRARGSLITGGSTSVPPALPRGWNDQVTEPCYSWNNTREGGAHVNFSAGDGVIRQNEHFFNDAVMPGYTPYTYPHPLTRGPFQAAPSAAHNLHKKWKKQAKELKRQEEKKVKQLDR